MQVKNNRCLYEDRECYLFGDCDICLTYQNRSFGGNFMKQLNNRLEWLDYFKENGLGYYQVKWVGMHDGKEHEEPVYFDRQSTEDGNEYIVEMVPSINDKRELSPILPYNQLPGKIIIVKSLTDEEVLASFE